MAGTPAQNIIAGNIARAVGSSTAGPINLQAQIDAARAANAGLSVNIAQNPSYQGGWPNGGPTAAAAGPSAADLAAQRAAAAAAAAEAQRVANIRNQLNVGVEGARTGASTSLNNIATTYGQQTRDFVQGYADQQEDLNNSRINSALNLRRSIASIADQIRQGQQSFGVQLGNMGASDSSAAQAGAKAYARMGSKQFMGVQNQNALENQTFTTQQQRLERSRTNKIDDFANFRQSNVDAISQDLFNQLRTLDVNAAAQGVSGAVDVGGVRSQVIDAAIARLNQLDQQFRNQVTGINGLDQNAVNAAAVQRDAAGATVANPYSYALDANAQFSGTPGGTGYAPISQLPIYLNKNDQQQLGIG